MSTTGQQLFSTLADGKLTVELVETEFAEPTGTHQQRSGAAVAGRWSLTGGGGDDRI